VSTIRVLVALAVGVTQGGRPLPHSAIQRQPIIDVHLHAYAEADWKGPRPNLIESAKFLTEEQRRDIFYNNAARFLRLASSDGHVGLMQPESPGFEPWSRTIAGR
jgi:hypothetical protein